MKLPLSNLSRGSFSGHGGGYGGGHDQGCTYCAKIVGVMKVHIQKLVSNCDNDLIFVFEYKFNMI